MAHPLRTVVVTGLSGSGKSTAARALEDLGYFCVDNLPAPLLTQLVTLCAETPTLTRLAVVVDVRASAMGVDPREVVVALRQRDSNAAVLYLDAQEETLVRRFSETRRRHPLGEAGEPIRASIEAEREQLAGMRAEATHLIDTTHLTLHDLRRTVAASFGGGTGFEPTVTVLSFGYKYGLPIEADYVFDMRLLPNPHFVEGLRAMSGLDRPVQEFLKAQPQLAPLQRTLFELFSQVVPAHEHEGRVQLTIALGCTGGRHRSVFMAEAAGEYLANMGRRVRVFHRDMGR
jgi:UPF0042 nucleotide-binding protein